MMNQKKAGILLIAGAFLLTITGSLTGIWIYKSYFETPQYVSFSQTELKPTFSKYTEADETTQPSNGPNFVAAARAARPAVVYIKSRYAIKRNNNRSDFFSNPFQDFFEDNYDESPRGMASGSGVLISPDGYIATNFHVIEDADELEVSLFDNRSFKAEIIGADPNTDLALIKIDAKGLDHLTFGNSDKVEVGAWVLAVGNPMDLTSTVTAGIVSAKGRNINLLEGERGTDRGLTIESFIQTDAAVNRGNSGGALVNIRGELIGINTAIASRTGSYAGYSFAIPATLVKKVMQDLLEFREVKRGFLGIRIQPITAPLAEEYELETLQGAFITSVNRNSGAYEAGLQAGDVIIEINGLPVNNTSELQEIVSRYRPGDMVEVNFFRDHAPRQLQVQLKDQLGEATLASRADRNETSIKGSDFRTLTEAELQELDIPFGIKVEEASSALERGGVPEDFVITEVNGEKIRSLSQFERAVEDAGDYVTIKGLFDKGRIASYSFSW
jgi:serine protease Do